jgi:hypothetical protein
VTRNGTVLYFSGPFADGDGLRDLTAPVFISSSGYWVFSQPEICCGDQSRISLLATMLRNFRWMERRQRLGKGILGKEGFWAKSPLVRPTFFRRTWL